MKEQHIFLFGYSLLVGGACLLMAENAWPLERLIIGGLVMACLLGARLLLVLAQRAAWLAMLFLAAAFVAALAFGGRLYPFAALLLMQAARQLGRGGGAALLGGVAIALLGVILWPPMDAVLLMLLCVVPLLFLDEIFGRLAVSHEQLAAKSEENELLRQSLSGQRKMAGAMEHAARLEERNRLAARIHDEVGHGVSGSVLLLEGAMLTMDKDPAKARAAVATATENLRGAVDDIRAALRQERAGRSEAGLSQLAAILSRFEAEHPAVATELITEGELAEVPPLVWLCIQENLTETLTNLLKHSSASRLSVTVAMQNKLVRASFKDNGAAGPFAPGLGLAVMEERCALCHGRCFFKADAQGFTTVMTFTQPKGDALDLSLT